MPGDLDFWIGEWDVRWDGGSGRNVVTAELGGTVVLERFDGSTLRGMSLSVRDRERGCWRQTWVDENGGYLEFAGGVGEDGVLELRHERRGADGEVVPFRMRFTEVHDDSLVWLWERGERNGAWTLEWRIEYARVR